MTRTELAIFAFLVGVAVGYAQHPEIGYPS